MIAPASRTGRPRALVCSPLPPEHDRESGSRRIHHFIEFLLEEGWDVAVLCENAPEGSRHLRELRQRGVPTWVGLGDRTDELVAHGAFDVAIVAFWYLAERYAERIRSLSPTTRIVVESVDLHWLRGARKVFGGRQEGATALDDVFAADMVAELNAYARADAVTTVSAKEAALVNDIVGDADLAHAVPDCDDVPRSPVPFEDRRGILFVGNFRHPPNIDAVTFLCEDIVPRLPRGLLREHPVQIVGNGLDRNIAALADGLDGVQVIGWVPSLVPYLHRARTTVVPLRYGAGTKRKLIQSLLARTPCVATSVGVEGIELGPDDLLVADDARGIAVAIERLMADRELWERQADRGRRRMLRSRGVAHARRALMEAIEFARSRAPKAGETALTLDSSTTPEALRRAVESVVPENARLLVVSKGDRRLADHPGRVVDHFPRAEGGGYAGYHPSDSRAAIRHLRELRGQADYLVVPAPSLWWLDYYSAFARHLASRDEEVWADDSCVIYRLAPHEGNGHSTNRLAAVGAGSDR